MEHLNIDDFSRYIEDIVRLSDSIFDGWQLGTREGSDNGKYIYKKQWMSLPIEEGKKLLVTYEYHIAYQLSYCVPVLCFNTWRQDGTMLTLEEYWRYNEKLQGSKVYETLTQMDHPVLGVPFLTLHPCKTDQILEPFLKKSKNPVVSWLSVVGPFVHMRVLEDYEKLC